MAGKTPQQWLTDNSKTQTWLAEQLGKSPAMVANLCAGKPTSYPVLRKLYEITDGEVTPNMCVLGKPA